MTSHTYEQLRMSQEAAAMSEVELLRIKVYELEQEVATLRAKLAARTHEE